MSESATTGPNVTGRIVSRKGDEVVLKIPGTDYQLHLVADGELNPDAQGDATGIIRGRAKRVDVVGSGGRFIEPAVGRPRRVQGLIMSGDAASNTITVHAGAAPFTVTLTDPRQKTADFMRHQMVSFDVERGATFGR